MKYNLYDYVIVNSEIYGKMLGKILDYTWGIIYEYEIITSNHRRANYAETEDFVKNKNETPKDYIIGPLEDLDLNKLTKKQWQKINKEWEAIRFYDRRECVNKKNKQGETDE